MNPNNEPTHNFQQLYEEIKKYVVLQGEYVKVEIVEKMTILLSTLLIIGLIVVLAIAVLFYLCFALAYAIAPVVGSLSVSFVIISLLYVLLIFVLLTFRNKLIINPLVSFLSNLFLKDENEL